MCEIVKDGVVNAEVVSTDPEGMLREGRELASWHPNIVVKAPMTPAGVRALHVLHGEGIQINVTLVFSAAQALLAAKAGTYFVSPFLGRLDDTAQDGLHVLREIMDIYRAYQFPRRFWLPASATRCTLSRRQKWAFTLARCDSRFSSSFSSTR